MCCESRTKRNIFLLWSTNMVGNNKAQVKDLTCPKPDLCHLSVCVSVCEVDDYNQPLFMMMIISSIPPSPTRNFFMSFWDAVFLECNPFNIHFVEQLLLLSYSSNPASSSAIALDFTHLIIVVCSREPLQMAVLFSCNLLRSPFS